MSGAIWYARYVGDYMRKTQHLSLMEHGAYTKLLDWYYANGRAPDANASVLHRICSAFAPDEQAAVASVVEQFFVVENGRCVHQRAEQELGKRNDLSEKRRDAAGKRWGKRGKNCKAKAGAKADAIAHTATVTSIPFPSGNGETDVSRDRPVDPLKELFDEGIAALTNLGIAETSARSMIGRFRKQANDDFRIVRDCIQEASAKRVADPFPWVSQAIKARMKANDDRSRDTSGIGAAFDRLEAKISGTGF